MNRSARPDRLSSKEHVTKRHGWRGMMRRKGRARRLLLLGLAAMFAASVAYRGPRHRRAAADRARDRRPALRRPRRPEAAGRRRRSSASTPRRSTTRTHVAVQARRARKVMDALRKDGAKVIGYDVQFTEQSPFPREDGAARSRRAQRRAARAATTEVGARREHARARRNGAAFQEIGGVIGNTIMPADPNGVRRRVPHSTRGCALRGRDGRAGDRRGRPATSSASAAR